MVDLGALREQITRSIVGNPTYTRVEVAEAVGFPVEHATRLWRAMGFPEVGDDEPVFTGRDIDALRTAMSLVRTGIVDDDTLVTLTRTMAQALSRLAVAHHDLAVDYLARTMQTGPENQAALAAAVADDVLPAVSSLLDYIWRRHLASAAESTLTATGPVGAGATVAAVGFADLEGFTELSRALSAEELGQLVESFESMAAIVVGAHHGRVVKTVGDEVMFTSSDVGAAAEIASDLATSDDDSLPAIRVGFAYGPVLTKMGDLYGPTVNIASRLTGIAYPGSVVVDREAAAALEQLPGWRLRPMKRRSVRGYENLAPYRLRRAD